MISQRLTLFFWFCAAVFFSFAFDVPCSCCMLSMVMMVAATAAGACAANTQSSVHEASKLLCWSVHCCCCHENCSTDSARRQAARGQANLGLTRFFFVLVCGSLPLCLSDVFRLLPVFLELCTLLLLLCVVFVVSVCHRLHVCRCW